MARPTAMHLDEIFIEWMLIDDYPLITESIASWSHFFVHCLNICKENKNIILPPLETNNELLR